MVATSRTSSPVKVSIAGGCSNGVGGCSVDLAARGASRSRDREMKPRWTRKRGRSCAAIGGGSVIMTCAGAAVPCCMLNASSARARASARLERGVRGVMGCQGDLSGADSGDFTPEDATARRAFARRNALTYLGRATSGETTSTTGPRTVMTSRAPRPASQVNFHAS